MRRGCAPTRGAWLAVMAFAVCAGPVEAEVLNIIQTDITGAQTFLNVDNSYEWTFSVAGPQTFDAINGEFTLKLAPGTVEAAVLGLYSANAAWQPTGLVGSYALPASVGTQNFTLYTFPLTSTSTSLNGNYYLTLTSDAPNANFTWYIKEPVKDLAFENDSGVTLSGFSGGAPGPAPVPEPAWPVGLVMGGGAAWAVRTQWRVWRRTRKREHAGSDH